MIITEEWRRIINCSSYLSCTARIKLRDCKLGWHNKTRLYVPLGKWGTKPSCVYGARDTGSPLVIILNEMKLVHSTHAVDNKTSVAVACFEVPRIFHVTAILVLHWRLCCNTFVPFEIENSCKYLPLASAENFTIARITYSNVLFNSTGNDIYGGQITSYSSLQHYHSSFHFPYLRACSIQTSEIRRQI